MKLISSRAFSNSIIVACFFGLLFADSSHAQKPTLDYNKDIRPILNRRCLSCHGGVRRNGGFSLLFRKDALEPTKSGALAIVPGNPDKSEMYKRITEKDKDLRMPPSGEPLKEKEIKLIKQWIKEGANWADHWAFVKPEKKPLPKVKNTSWPETDLDFHVLAKLESKKLKPSPQAAKVKLIRRVTLDLTGLPPTPEEIDAFVSDTSPDAWEKVVDRLLASPRFGERWAAMWLDLARYADTKGYEQDGRRTIWLFRDWVIDAFNSDMPFDQFTIKQLAGDLLPNATDDDKTATAFHRNTMTNDEGGTDDEEFRVAAVLDRVNTTWEVWQGTTFSCVQCHSHPYDPFRHEEYYQFMAFLNNTADSDKNNEHPLLQVFSKTQLKQQEEIKQHLTQLEKQIAKKSKEANFKAATEKWANGLQKTNDWQILKPQTVSSNGKTTYEISDDGRILAKGEVPPTEIITTKLTTQKGKLSALRLEAIPHESLPKNSVGRNAGGNFVLSKIEATLIPKNKNHFKGKFVRIEIPGMGKILSLAEVQIFSGGKNIALQGKAKQSSTGHGGAAKRAIDNNTSGIYGENSITHTNTENNPWWEVALAGTKPIEKIVLWNRIDGNLNERLNGSVISILDESRQIIWKHKLEKATKKEMPLEIKSREVKFKAAVADFSQHHFSINDVLNNTNLKNKGWAVAPKAHEKHFAVFSLDAPIEMEAGDTLEVKLYHLFQTQAYDKHSLGHFRFSTGSSTTHFERTKLSPQLITAIDTPAAKRDEKQKELLANHYAQFSPETMKVQHELTAGKKSLQAIKPVTVPVMQELPKEKSRVSKVFDRGNWLMQTTEVHPGVPKSLSPMPVSAPPNRLGMAQWLVAADNTLTARVIVNRFWEQIFGIGIVETVEDFGTQGEAPVNQALLDHMALRFIHEHKWSVKTLLKEIVMSKTYRQDSKVTPELYELDPRNRLLARGSRVRLSAEQIRDQALAVAGLLSDKSHGPSVMPHQPIGVWQTVYSGDKWNKSKGEDQYRRGLYTFWRRTAPYPSMIAFDAVSREFCVSRRIRTNTPLAALVTLNDPVFFEAAAAFAKRMTKQSETLEDQIRYGYKTALAREAKPEQITALSEFYNQSVKYFQQHPEESKNISGSSQESAMTMLANVMLNLDELIMKE